MGIKILGHIEYFNPEKGFGFIFDADGSRLKRFFHVSQVISGVPAAGRLCEYEPGQRLRGAIALDVEVFAGLTTPSVSAMAGLDGDSK